MPSIVEINMCKCECCGKRTPTLPGIYFGIICDDCDKSSFRYTRVMYRKGRK